MDGEATARDGRRLRLHVRGAVQGVGFRPYVYGLATRYRLGGFVANDSHGVVIEVEGERASDFVRALPLEKPPLARIDEISVQPVGAVASEGKACAGDYADPDSRRFHAEAIACPQCGPRLSHGIEDIAAAIAAGKIVAVKGLGGYQLVCDARDEAAVQRLRQCKQRDQKPFAVMVGSVDAVAGIADADAAELALLETSPRPIVLMTSRHRLSPAIAPELARIGIALPVTPLLHLIFEALDAAHPLAGELGDRRHQRQSRRRAASDRQSRGRAAACRHRRPHRQP